MPFPLATIQYHSLSYRSSAAVRSLPKLCFLESFREPPPVPWKQRFKERAPQPELGCQRTTKDAKNTKFFSVFASLS